jgi:hypothetical protein
MCNRRRFNVRENSELLKGTSFYTASGCQHDCMTVHGQNFLTLETGSSKLLVPAFFYIRPPPPASLCINRLLMPASTLPKSLIEINATLCISVGTDVLTAISMKIHLVYSAV